MTDTPTTTERTLKDVLASIAEAYARSLREESSRPVELGPGVVRAISGLKRAIVAHALPVRRHDDVLWVLLDPADATMFAGTLLGDAEDVVRARRMTGQIGDRELHSLDAVGARLTAELADRLEPLCGGDAVFAVPATRWVTPDDPIASQPLAQYSFHCRMGDHPASLCHIAVGQSLATAWAGRSESGLFDGLGEDTGKLPTVALEAFEDIPAAEIQGRLAGYLCDQSAAEPVRRSCRRVGLEFERHGPAEVPNPAAHAAGDIVLLDVPVTEHRRFDWCKRFKQHQPDAKVMLLIHHPSRNRVLQGFMSRADAIVGWPSDERQLAVRLQDLAQPATAPR